jgi:hypothetical protein
MGEYRLILRAKTTREVHDKPIIEPRGRHVAKRLKEFMPLDTIDLFELFRRQTMYFVFKSILLHFKEHLVKYVKNLCHERYLPVEMRAVGIYGKGMRLGLLTGINLYMNLRSEEFELGTIELEVLYCVHKLQETWDGNRELLVEDNVEPLQAGSGDPTNNHFQVSGNTSEQKPSKVRKCYVL